MEMNYKPLGDRVVIEIIKRHDEKTKGGLYKPAGSETTSEGSGGVQITNTNLDLKSGITIYGRYTEIDVNAGQIIAYIGQ